MDFTDPHFIEPLRLWLLLPAVILLTGLHVVARRARAAALDRLASPVMIERLLAGYSRRVRGVKEALFIAGILVALIAFARPAWGIDPRPRSSEVEDVVFALDTSRSMTATDVAPSRLTRAKRAIEAFVAAHPQGRMGLVVFSGEAFLQCPLTLDRSLFIESLDAADERVIPTAGTDVGAAIEEARQAFGEKSGRRTIVLVSDGEDLEGAGLNLAKKLGRESLIIHTIGIGTDAGRSLAPTEATPVPVVTRLDERTLRGIAQASGGHFVRLGVAGASAESIEAQLTRLASASGNRREPMERFPLVLGLALLLLAVEPLLVARKRLVGDSAPLAKLAPLLLVVIGIGGGLPAAHAGLHEDFYNTGVEALKNDSLVEAEESFRRALQGCDDSLRSKALHNLAVTRARAVSAALAAREKAGKRPAKESEADAKKDLPPIPERWRGTVGIGISAYGLLDSTIVAIKKSGGKANPMQAVLAYKIASQMRASLRHGMKDLMGLHAAGVGQRLRLDRVHDDLAGADELAPGAPATLAEQATLARFVAAVDERLADEKARRAEGVAYRKAIARKLKELRELLPPEMQKQLNQGEEKEDGTDEDPSPDNKDGDPPPPPPDDAQKMSREEALAMLQSYQAELRRRLTTAHQPVDPKAAAQAQSKRDW